MEIVTTSSDSVHIDPHTSMRNTENKSVGKKRKQSPILPEEGEQAIWAYVPDWCAASKRYKVSSFGDLVNCEASNATPTKKQKREDVAIRINTYEIAHEIKF